ncbi:unnamed protein product [Callosobruchus maculatus]|uniref:Uncharacterized protein n=1 Tax=Callosobruchus maculatus TaxID=64391 RepID=A0A653DAF9_CALMS|nr:unnamed protein product [Callosobruchus maculatus]
MKAPTEEELELFTLLLYEVVVPDATFQWIAESRNCDLEVMKAIVARKLLLDQVIRDIVSMLQSINCTSISVNSLAQRFRHMERAPSVYEQYYIFKLLSGDSCVIF